MTLRLAPLAAAGLFALVGINAWLGAIIIEGIVKPDDIPTQRIDWRPTLATPPEDVTTTKPISHYDQTLARPIFFKSRQPFVASPPPPPAPLPAARAVSAPVNVDPGLSVGGVLITGQMKKTYLFRKTDSSGEWVNQGEAFMGWKVQAIDPKGVTLQKEERIVELRLYPEPARPGEFLPP